MEILINESISTESNTPGFNVTFVTRNKKKVINDSDFFSDGSDIGQKITQLKRLLKIYFDAQV
jgi:hypothetical protein